MNHALVKLCMNEYTANKWPIKEMTWMLSVVHGTAYGNEQRLHNIQAYLIKINVHREPPSRAWGFLCDKQRNRLVRSYVTFNGFDAMYLSLSAVQTTVYYRCVAENKTVQPDIDTARFIKDPKIHQTQKKWRENKRNQRRKMEFQMNTGTPFLCLRNGWSKRKCHEINSIPNAKLFKTVKWRCR